MDFKSKTKSQLIAEIEILQNKINSFESSSTIDQIQENETEGKYRSFFENAFDGLIHLDLKGNILDVNKAAVNFFGGKKEELIGKHFTKTGVVSKKDIPLLLKTFANTITGKKASISLEITNKSEEKIFLECNTSFIRKNKKIAGVMGIARDITEYKKSEIELQESEQRFRMLMEKSPVCIEIFDKDGVLLDVNEAWENTWGVNGEEIIGKYNPLDNEQFKMMGLLPLIEQAFAGESVQLPDVEFDPAASGLPGRKLWIRGYAYHLEDKDSNVKNVIMLSENITEQKLAEEEIRKSEEKYRSIFESFQDLYYRTDSQGIVTLVSPSVRQLGYEPEELIGRPAADFFANPSDRSKFMEEISLSGSVQDYEVKIQNKEDENLYASLTASLIEEEDGNLVGIEGVIRDITKRKKSEKQLRESEEKFRLINEQSLVGIVIIQENEIKHINEAVFQISETEKSEFEKSALKGIMKQVHPDDVQMVQDQLQKKQKGEQQGTVPNYVFRLIPNSGQTKWLEIYSKTIVYNDDPADLIMLLDITERKEAANQIKQLQEYLQLQVERMPVGLIVWDTDFRVESWNSAAENIFGYTAEEILGKHPYDFIVPEDIQPKLDAIWDRLFDGDMTAYSENDNVTKDGRRITCNWSNTPLREDDGTIIGVLSMVEDITQQKIAMSDLQESEEKYRILFETMEQGVVYQDVNGEITSANPAAERLLGLTIEQMQGRTSIDPRWKAIKEDGSDFQGEKHPSMIALKDGRSVRDTVMGVFIPTTDSYRWIIVNAVPQFKTGEDRTYQVFTTFSDITEIKKTEERMRFMKFSIDHSADSAFWMGPDAQFIYVNEAVCESLGYTPEEMLTMTVHDIDPDFPQDVWLDHWKDMKQLKSFSMESHHRKKDGQVFPVEVTVNYVEFEGQEYNCAFSKDITERKIAEQALSESERQYRTIFESLQDLFYRTDHEGNILLVSPSVRQFGYEPEDLIGCSSTDFYSDPSDGDKFMKIIMEEGSITSYEIQLTKKDGTVVDASITASLLKNDDGSFAGIEGVLRDISENKKAEEELKASEERYHGLADASFEAVFISEKGICLDANRAACEMFGYECDELIGIFGTDVIAPESKELVKSNMTSGFEEPYEALAQRKDGSTFYCEIHGKMTEHKGRDVRITVLRDVDEKRRAEVALRESEEQYRAIFESFQDIYYRTDKKGKLTLISPSVRKYGYEPEDLLGHYVSDYYTNPRERRYLMKKIAQDGFVEDYEVQLVANDGTIIDSSLNAHLFADEAGNAVGVEGILRVITERKHAENLTRIQKELAIKLGETTSIEKALADCIDAAIQISIMDSGGIYLVDPETGDIDLSYSEGFKPEYVKMVSHYKSDSNNAIIVNAGKPIHVTHAELNIDLSDIERSEGLKCISVIPILHEGRAVGCMNMGSHSKGDISEFEKEVLESIAGMAGGLITRLKTEEKLQESEERYRQLFEDDLTGDYISTPEGHITTCNPAFAKILGFKSVEDVYNVPIITLYQNPDDREYFLEQIKKMKKLEYYEKQYLKIDGNQIHVIENAIGVFDDSDKLTHIRGYIIDNTERKLLEEQLQQSQKMESIGLLAGGIAHDFNNLLTAIIGNTELAMFSLDERDPMMEDLNAVRESADRAADLTRQLLAFSRKQTLQPKVLNMNLIVQNLEKMLRRMIGEDIDLKIKTFKKLKMVKVDPGQIEQVLVNLVVNARDAMNMGGKLTIETQNITLDEEYSHIHIDAVAGQYVLIAISDSGTGMSDEVKLKIFDPFFTTKSEGKGTGLGLSMVYGIIKQSGGHISVYSEIGHGTTFKIYLPAVEEKADAHERKQDISKAPRGNETLLLVEDAHDVRTLAVKILKRQGYHVFEAASGGDAIVICDKMDKPVDLVVTDVIMPHMSGRELAEKLRDRWSDLKVLYMSGYTDDAIVHHGILDQGIPYLQKPFRPLDIAIKVREVLDN